jgi:hypothetical protein
MAGRAALQLALALLYDIVTLVCNSTNFSLLMNATWLVRSWQEVRVTT